MNKKLIASGLIALTLAIGCTQYESSEVKAGKRSDFNYISESEISSFTIYKIKDENGCYHTVTVSNRGSNVTPEVEQMYINSGGRTVPYCKKVK